MAASALLFAAEPLLLAFWAVSAALIGVSVLVCACVVVTRVWRNRQLAGRTQRMEAFRTALSTQLSRALPARDEWDNVAPAPLPACEPDAAADVLLSFFRALRGGKAARLRALVARHSLEAGLIDTAARGPTRGSRMRALRVLSFLDTQDSLQAIHARLASPVGYERLVAARALVERGADVFLDAIMDSYAVTFPGRPRELADIVQGFGAGVCDRLEAAVRRNADDTITAAALMALAALQPPRTALDLRALMEHPDALVRASALELWGVSERGQHAGVLDRALADTSTAVKIRAAKVALAHRHTASTPALHCLAEDGHVWVRYWAVRALWAGGAAERQFVDTLARTNATASAVILEMRAGHNV